MTNIELIRQEIERLQEAQLDEFRNFNSEYKEGIFDGLSMLDTFIDSLQQEQPVVDLENYIVNKLRELGADLINHKPYSFNRGLNVGKANSYRDILNRLNARKEE